MQGWEILPGLVLLMLGGEAIVRGAVNAARRLGVSELLIGLTLVGFGTSTPELITSLNAAFQESPGISIGNVVGSNISNILLIFALVCVVRPVQVNRSALARDGFVLLASTLLLIVVALWLGALSRWVGVAFLLGLAAYLTVAWRQESASPQPAKAEAEATPENRPMPLWAALGLALLGLALLIFGADLLVRGARSLAAMAGLSETVIGLTIVALGTSLPELVASLAAALRGRSEVVLGTVVGSNIYNVLGILGITAAVHPIAIPADMVLRDWVFLYAATLLLLLHTGGARVSRAEGAFMLAHFGLYVWLLLDPAALSPRV